MDTLTEEEKTELRAIFDEFDADKSGKLDPNELLSIAQCFGQQPSKAEIEDLKVKHDINGDNGIDFDEVLAVIMDLYKSAEERWNDIIEAMKTIYQCKGIDQDEPITKEQFLTFFEQYGDDPLSKEEVDELFRDLDKDGDTDTITKEELATFFNP